MQAAGVMPVKRTGKLGIAYYEKGKKASWSIFRLKLSSREASSSGDNCPCVLTGESRHSKSGYFQSRHAIINELQDAVKVESGAKSAMHEPKLC